MKLNACLGLKVRWNMLLLHKLMMTVCERTRIEKLASPCDLPISAHLSLKLSSVLFNKLVSIALWSKLLLRTFYSGCLLYLLFVSNSCGSTWVILAKLSRSDARVLVWVWSNVINLFISRCLIKSNVGYFFRRDLFFVVYWFEFLVRLAAITLRRATCCKASVVWVVLSLNLTFIYWSKIYFIFLFTAILRRLKVKSFQVETRLFYI
jgi:hypothetical protein